MALARIKEGQLVGRDYIKFNYGTGNYPRVSRRWEKVPVEVCYHIEKNKHPDFDFHYELGDIPYKDTVKQEKADSKEIDEMLGVKEVEVKVKKTSKKKKV